MRGIADLIVAFIRKSDGAIYARNPEKNNIWIISDSGLKEGLSGWPHWNTDLFISFIADGSFDCAFTDEAKNLMSDFYRGQKKIEEDRITDYEARSGECYYCHMLLNNCLCYEK